MGIVASVFRKCIYSRRAAAGHMNSILQAKLMSRAFEDARVETAAEQIRFLANDPSRRALLHQW